MGVVAAVVLAEGLAAAGLSTSKRGAFARAAGEKLLRAVRALFAQGVGRGGANIFEIVMSGLSQILRLRSMRHGKLCFVFCPPFHAGA